MFFKRIPPDFIQPQVFLQCGQKEARWQLQLIAQPRLAREENSVKINPIIPTTEPPVLLQMIEKRNVLLFAECSLWSVAFVLFFFLFLHWRLVSFSLLGLKQKSHLRVDSKCQPTSRLLFWLPGKKKFCF